MKALAKVMQRYSHVDILLTCAFIQLVATNNPDKIIFVGEALVGNEAVDQLSQFDRALRDFSSTGSGGGRGIDGMLVTKWDTVDDKVGSVLIRTLPFSQLTALQVGAALSMTYVTTQPIYFVGCGQVIATLVVQNGAHILYSDIH